MTAWTLQALFGTINPKQNQMIEIYSYHKKEMVKSGGKKEEFYKVYTL